MNQMFAKRPSGAMVVAIVALVIAATGTAVAATGGNGDQLIKKGTLSGNRLRNDTVGGKQVKERTLGKVPRAKVADSAVTAGHATSANTAGHATSANTASDASTIAGVPLTGITARAYAFVSSTGVLDTSRSKNIASVTPKGGGKYCVLPSSSSGIDPTKEFPVVIADEDPTSGATDRFHVAEIDSNANCNGGWPILTYSILSTGPAFQDVNFALVAP